MPLPNWHEISPGGIVTTPGNSVEYETGGWRSQRPILDMKNCNSCLLCWIFCPDGSIELKDGKIQGMDLKHCKGCGICANECPRKTITMVDEAKARAESGK